MKLAGDNREGVKANSWESADPAPAEITEAIDRLDGQRYTEVSISEDDPWRYLTVAGGPDLYLVTGETGDEKILQLLDPKAGAETVSLVAGGQKGEFQRRQLVDRAAALAAVEEFRNGFKDGFGDQWEVQEPPS